MASAMMLKIKPNSKLPLQFLCSPMSSLIRPVGTIPQPQVTNESSQKKTIFPVLGMTQNLFTGELGFSGVRSGGFRLAGGAVSIRQMGTSRSTRGSSSKNEDFEDDDVEDFDDDNDEDTVDFDDDDDVDSFDEDEVDSEGFEDDDEEEKPKRKKRF
ncbi:hypothetical protein TanjilG_29860 [Lupinus angustifolius]|uniref:Uncharacterized protein n=1 Tax=Lupinus angustifolius TaxID=3871 RepID=A0A4P1RAQ0_LUPAN|nr:hypothetical protein TanjilG_29860 [Lupinus angustifolius]